MISESLVQSFQSPRPLVERCGSRGPRCELCPGLSGGLMDLQSALVTFYLSQVGPHKAPKSCSMELVELEEYEGSKACLGFPWQDGESYGDPVKGYDFLSECGSH